MTRPHPRSGAFVPFGKDAIEQSIPCRFEEQARRHRDRLAVKSGDDALTYGALNCAANRVAHAVLRRLGEEPEPVALLLEQGGPAITAILGLLKAGKIYVPLDPAAPRARIVEMVEESQARLVLTDGVHAALARAPGGPDVMAMEQIDASASAENPAPSIPPDAIAYVFYTSGSTGRPKGVPDTHRNVLHNVMRYTDTLGIGADDRLTLLQSPSFSGSVSSLFAALLNGAAVFPFDIRKEGVDRIAGWLAREAITIYHSVPSLFRHVAASGELLTSLRLIRLEGDQASVRDVELFQRHFPSTCTLVNGLGATECGLVRQYFVGSDSPVPAGVVPIGYAVEDMDVLVLDAAGREVGGGGVGEIAVRSPYLAPGYWRRPDLTAASFSPDPGGSAARIYRTGDFGRLRPDGCLEHLGRKDFQRKIKGHRVEAGEIEAALLAGDDVREAVVEVREDGSGEARLVAYVVPTERPGPTVSTLRERLAATLPDYLIPSTYVLLDALPLNANGKVDRRALPAPGRARPALLRAFVAPRTQLEEVLAGIWADVLELDCVGVADDFLELGGDSLLATRIVSRVRDRLHLDLDVRSFFETPTVAGLARAVLTGQQ